MVERFLNSVQWGMLHREEKGIVSRKFERERGRRDEEKPERKRTQGRWSLERRTIQERIA